MKLETAINGVAGQLVFVIPERLTQSLRRDDVPAESNVAEPRPDLKQVQVQLASLTVSAETIASLKVGDVISLGETDLQTPQVLIGGEPVFFGSPGLNSGRKAVQLRERISSESHDWDEAD